MGGGRHVGHEPGRADDTVFYGFFDAVIYGFRVTKVVCAGDKADVGHDNHSFLS